MNQTTSEHSIDGNDIRTRLNDGISQLDNAARGALIRLDKSGNALFQELITRGESLRDKTTDRIRKAREEYDWRTWLAATLGLPTNDELVRLNRKLDRINRKVNKLAREQKA